MDLTINFVWRDLSANVIDAISGETVYTSEVLLIASNGHYKDWVSMYVRDKPRLFRVACDPADADHSTPDAPSTRIWTLLLRNALAEGGPIYEKKVVLDIMTQTHVEITLDPLIQRST